MLEQLLRSGKGSMSKAQQRQQQKNKRGKKWGFHRVRMNVIPVVCAVCGETRVFSSKEAYRKGGNWCVHQKLYPRPKYSRYSFDMGSFPKPQLIKVR